MTLAIVGAVATPSHARAQPPPHTPTFQEKESARKLLDQGRAAEAKGDLTLAIERYRAADAIMSAATTGIYLAHALAKNGNLIEARDVALRTSREPKLPGERPERTLARNEGAKLLAELGPRVPSVTVDARPPGARGLTVTIDGKALPEAVIGQPWSVDPGAHTVTVAADDFVSQTVDLTVKEAESRAVAIDLVPVALPETPPVAPIAPKTSPAPAPADDGVEPAWVLAITGLVVGGAGLTVGGITGGLSLSKTSTIEDACAGTKCPSSLAADGEDAQTLATVSNVAFAVGGALAAAGLVGVIVMSTSSDDADPAVSLSISPLGFECVGSF